MTAPTNKTENRLGKYRVLADLGRGGMAMVQLAVIEGPSGFNKLVVLKQILPQYAHDPEILEMFLDEARLAARLSHSNVVQTNEVGFERDTHFLAMEYLDGQPLTRILQRLRQHGDLPLAMHLQVIADLLAGLHYAHELADYDGTPLGVVHRDVSPHNTFVTYDGVVKVLDFGIAQARTALAATRSAVVKGKLAYMAPEQLRGEEVDRTADIFAVGVMLWEAATGKRPWKGLATSSMLAAVLAGHFPAPCSSNPDVPLELEAIILKALSLEPKNRYATAAELQTAIDAYLDTVGGRLPQREVGKLISTHFASERAVITAVIEEQLQAPEAAPLPILVPKSDGDRDTLEPPASPGSETSAPEGSALTIPDAAWRFERGGTSPGGRTPRPGSRWKTMAETLAAQARAAVRPRPALAAVIILIVLAYGVARHRSLPDPVLVIHAAASAEPTSSAPVAAASVELQLIASPPQARFFLDDAPLEGNPHRSERAIDGRARRLRVEAPGFVSRQESITIDRNTLIEIELASDAVTLPSATVRDAPRSRANGVPAPSRAPIIVRHW